MSAGQRPVALRQAEASRPETPQLSVSPAVFRKFQQLIYAETGIWLGAAKTALLCGRLFRRLRALGIASLEDYYERVSKPGEHAERTLMIDAITTNETRFFREPRQFDFLVQQVFPKWCAQAAQGERSKRVRVWSAGCSSGEEPYSLAMLLAEHLPADRGWDAHVLATDISTRMLEKAQKGVYDASRSAEIPHELLHKFMLRGIAGREGQIKVSVGIQKLVEFRRLNLSQETYEIQGLFDLVLCRNVLIYFDAASKRKVVAQLVDHLAADGFLFVGHAENLTSLVTQLRSVEPTIYARKRAGQATETNLGRGFEQS